MSTYPVPICYDCLHLNRDDTTSSPVGRSRMASRCRSSRARTTTANPIRATTASSLNPSKTLSGSSRSALAGETHWKEGFRDRSINSCDLTWRQFRP